MVPSERQDWVDRIETWGECETRIKDHSSTGNFEIWDIIHVYLTTGSMTLHGDLSGHDRSFTWVLSRTNDSGLIAHQRRYLPELSTKGPKAYTRRHGPRMGIACVRDFVVLFREWWYHQTYNTSSLQNITTVKVPSSLWSFFQIKTDPIYDISMPMYSTYSRHGGEGGFHGYWYLNCSRPLRYADRLWLLLI